MLESDRQSDQPLGDAGGVPHRLRHAGVGGRGGMADRNSVPPRLTASLKSCSAFRIRKLKARSSAPRKRRSSPGRCIAARRWRRYPGRRRAPGAARRRQDVVGQARPPLPLSAARSMRSDSVSMERDSIQQECGSSWKPKALRVCTGLSSSLVPVIRRRSGRNGRRRTWSVNRRRCRRRARAASGRQVRAWCCRRRRAACGRGLRPGVGRVAHQRQVDHRVRRVRRRLQVDHLHRP